jgi:hypothetical protein
MDDLDKGLGLLLGKGALVLQPATVAGNTLDLLAVEIGH